MADTNKMNRTWLCSVVFMDIVNYSSQSVEVQIRWKDRFNGYLASAIKDVPEDERVILDTGDGAATCFLGAPEAAMFTSLELWHSLLTDEREQQTPMRVRIGINLGPVKLVRDINGAPNAIGDGMNAGQRVMSFAGENQILVSQSYFEVVSRLSDDYKKLFSLKGVETDKHIREHTVYHLSPPGVQHVPARVQTAEEDASVAAAASSSTQPAPPPQKAAQSVAAMVAAPLPESRPENQSRRNRSIPLVVGCIAVVLVAAAAAWHFAGSPAPAKSSVNAPAAAPTAPVPPSSPVAAAPAATSTPAPKPVIEAPVVTAGGNPRAKQAVAPSTPVTVEQAPAPAPARPQPPTERVPEAPSVADQATARDLRERYNVDASRAAAARTNAEVIRQRLAAKGMSLNSQTNAAIANLDSLLSEAADALRDRRWDDALSNLQAVEATIQKVNSAVGN